MPNIYVQQWRWELLTYMFPICTVLNFLFQIDLILVGRPFFFFFHKSLMFLHFPILTANLLNLYEQNSTFQNRIENSTSRCITWSKVKYFFHEISLPSCIFLFVCLLSVNVKFIFLAGVRSRNVRMKQTKNTALKRCTSTLTIRV